MKMTGKLLTICMILAMITFNGQKWLLNFPNPNTEVRAMEQVDEKVNIPEEPLELEVLLKRRYLDGDVSEETVTETIWALEDFWAKYEKWQLVDINEQRIVFEREENDISPLLKVNGFFGLQEDGTLTIFNGAPEQADIIHSFFQIDMKKLEGKKKEELERGIPIQTKEIYNEVMEALKQFAIEQDTIKKQA